MPDLKRDERLYAVFGVRERHGLVQMSIPLSLAKAKEFMRISQCIMFYTRRRIRRVRESPQ